MAGLVQKIKLFGECFPWFQSLRETAMEVFLAQDVPTPKTENGKYTKQNGRAHV